MVDSETWLNVSVLQGSLWDAARVASTEALRQFLGYEPNYAGVVLNTGFALEYLAKWCLCTTSPVLLAKNPDALAILFFLGSRTISSHQLRRLKTISGPEACERVAEVHAASHFKAESVGILFDYRNAITHLSLMDRSKALNCLQTGFRLIRDLLDFGGSSWEFFWVERADVSAKLLDGVTTDIEASVLVKMSEAKRYYSDLCDRQGDRMQAYVSSIAIDAVSLFFDEFADARTCPVCTHRGVLTYDREGTVSELMNSATPELIRMEQEISPGKFQCPVCMLHLNGNEVHQAGIRVARRMKLIVKSDRPGIYEVSREIIEN